MLAGVLLIGGYYSGSDRFPLISTWSLGVTMSMPFLAYAVGLTLLTVTVLKLISSGRPLIGYGLVLIFLSHRMLPLTYFNLLILIGFLLIAVASRADHDEVPDRQKICGTRSNPEEVSNAI